MKGTLRHFAVALGLVVNLLLVVTLFLGDKPSLLIAGALFGLALLLGGLIRLLLVVGLRVRLVIRPNRKGGFFFVAQDIAHVRSPRKAPALTGRSCRFRA